MRNGTKIAGLVTAVGIAITGGFALAGPASAADGPKAFAESKRAVGKYVDYGDKFWLKDKDGDGRSAVIQWDLGAASLDWKTHWNKKGYGETKWWNLGWPEGKLVRYRVCVGEGSTNNVFEGTCGAVARTRS